MSLESKSNNLDNKNQKDKFELDKIMPAKIIKQEMTVDETVGFLRNLVVEINLKSQTMDTQFIIELKDDKLLHQATVDEYIAEFTKLDKKMTVTYDHKTGKLVFDKMQK